MELLIFGGMALAALVVFGVVAADGAAGDDEQDE